MGCAAIDHLKELVLDDGEVRARLLGTADTQVSVSDLLEVARSHGLEVSARDLDEAILGARRHYREHRGSGEVRLSPLPPSTAVARSLSAWTPVVVTSGTRVQLVRWCFTEGIDFTEPFFAQTVERCLCSPLRLLLGRETTVDELAAWAASNPGLEPAGLVFHASRCGSTLVAQLFASLASTLVLSEPEPLDHVLRSGEQQSLEEDEVVRRLRWLVSAMAQPRRPEQERLIIKLDAWAVLWWGLLRRAFPMTPFVFLYREPGEVVASHLARPGYHMVPGSLPREKLFGEPHPQDGFNDRALTAVPPEVYCAAVVAALFKAALDAARLGEMSLCHYRELPGLVPMRLAPLFGVGPGPNGPDLFAEVAGRDAKNPWLPFSSARRPLLRVPPAVQAAVNSSAGPAYERLESLRTAGLEEAGVP
jgi:hypothetical protein